MFLSLFHLSTAIRSVVKAGQEGMKNIVYTDYSIVLAGEEWLLTASHWIDREGTGNEGRIVNDQVKAKRERMAAQKYKSSSILPFTHTLDDHTLSIKHHLFANQKHTEADRMGWHDVCEVLIICVNYRDD